MRYYWYYDDDHSIIAIVFVFIIVTTHYWAVYSVLLLLFLQCERDAKNQKNSLFGIDPGLSRRMNWCCLHCSLGPHFFCGDETGSTANPPKHRQIKDNKVIIRISGDHMHEYAISYIVTSSYITMSKLSPKICTLTKTPKVLSAVMQGTCGTSGG